MLQWESYCTPTSWQVSHCSLQVLGKHYFGTLWKIHVANDVLVCLLWPSDPVKILTLTKWFRTYQIWLYYLYCGLFQCNVCSSLLCLSNYVYQIYIITYDPCFRQCFTFIATIVLTLNLQFSSYTE